MIEVADSLVVRFGSGADSSALVRLELDDVLNDGKTSFSPGDTINIRLHHDSSVQLGRMLSTDGMMAWQGHGLRQISEQFLFAEPDDVHQLSCVPASSLSTGFYGREATGLLRSSSRDVVISGGDLPSLAAIDYQADFLLYRLLAPEMELSDDESYPIYIVAYMESR